MGLNAFIWELNSHQECTMWWNCCSAVQQISYDALDDNEKTGQLCSKHGIIDPEVIIIEGLIRSLIWLITWCVEWWLRMLMDYVIWQMLNWAGGESGLYVEDIIFYSSGFLVPPRPLIWVWKMTQFKSSYWVDPHQSGSQAHRQELCTTNACLGATNYCPKHAFVVKY